MRSSVRSRLLLNASMWVMLGALVSFMNQTLSIQTESRAFQKPDAVLLDLDGTIINTVPTILASFREACRAETGIDLSNEEMVPLLGMNDFDTRRHFIAKFSDPAFPYSQIRARQTGIQRELFAAGVELKPGALELIEVLKQESLPFGVHTGGNTIDTELKLRSSRLALEVRAYVTGDHVPNGKPSPRMLLRLRRMLEERNATSLQDCMVVGDGGNDIKAGRNGRMRTVYIPDHTEDNEVVALANYSFSSLSELTRRFAERH